jgi:SAM-dependent methyltransferase
MERLKRILSRAMPSVGTKNQSNREIWLERTLKLIPANSRILDAGAGEQQYKRFCKHLFYVAQDFARYNGKGNLTGLQTGSWDQSKLDIVSDITSIPEPDGSFDVILCVEVFEHLPQPLRALQEFKRLLRPGGYLILTAPFCSLTHFAPYHFYSGFNKYFYETHLPEFDFTIIELVPNGNYFEYLAQELRRLPSIQKKYTKKNSISSWLTKYQYLNLLDSLSAEDSGSSELLNFGYHVFAKKIG